MIQSFVKCLSPLILKDSHGYPYQVPCGHCVEDQDSTDSITTLVTSFSNNHL